MSANGGNRANHARTARVKRMERLNPGMVVFAGPFDIQSSDPELKQKEIDACRRMKQDFQRAKVLVKVILNQDGAWVLRARAGLHTCATAALDRYASDHQHAGRRRGGQWA